MSKQVINVGAAPNDGSGDPARTAFGSVGANFDEVYTMLGDGSTLIMHLRNQSAAPGPNDDAANTSGSGVFAVGSTWFDAVAGRKYECFDATAGAAAWKELLVDDSGQLLPQTAGESGDGVFGADASDANNPKIFTNVAFVNAPPIEYGVRTLTATGALTAADINGLVFLNAAAALQLDISASGTLALPVGFSCGVVTMGAGPWTVGVPAGVSLNGTAGPHVMTFANAGEGATLIQRVLDEWHLIGAAG